MAATEQLAIVRLGPDDARAGLALSTEAQWNQNEADWRFFLTAGEVFGVHDREGLLIASAALLPYGSGNAWISMVLVTANWRRRGLATKLVDACLAAAAKQGLTTWLDATPAGAAVYGPLGFAPTLQLRRLRLRFLETCRKAVHHLPRSLKANHSPLICAIVCLDRAAAPISPSNRIPFFIPAIWMIGGGIHYNTILLSVITEWSLCVVPTKDHPPNSLPRASDLSCLRRQWCRQPAVWKSGPGNATSMHKCKNFSKATIKTTSMPLSMIYSNNSQVPTMP